MTKHQIVATIAAVASLGAAAPAAEAKPVLRWEKLSVPVAEDATASSAVVSLGKLGRVE